MHVLFDLNGTLTDVGPLAAPRELAVRVFDDAVMQAMVDTAGGVFRPFRDHVRVALAQVGRDGDRGAEAVQALPAHDDAAAALRAVRAAGHVSCVLTNSSAPAGRATLEGAGLLDLVDEIFSVEVIKAYKPDPRVYDMACTALEADPAETWMVSGHWWDVAGAKHFGLRTAWVARDEQTLRATVPDPDVRAADLAGAVTALLAAS